MTTDELIQAIRTLKMSQVRKQLEEDQRLDRNTYLDGISGKWVSRFQIIQEFFAAVKEQS